MPHGNILPMIIAQRLIAILLLALTGCTLAHPEQGPLVITATPAALQATPVPTINRDRHDIPTETPAASPTPGMFDCDIAVETPTTQHTVVADLSYANKSVAVQQRIDYVNRTGNDLSAIVLNVRPNNFEGVFHLDSLQLADGSDLQHILRGEQLTVTLPEPLRVGCQISLKLSFQLHIPQIDITSLSAYQGYLGYSSRQINLGQWMPVVATQQGDSWVTHQETSIGEQEVLDVADWDVTLNVPDAPDNLRLAAPGDEKENTKGHWRYVMTAGRDFSISLGEGFNLLSEKSKSGTVVELYSFEDTQLPSAEGVIDTAAFAMDSAVKAVDLYSNLYGQYPRKRLVIVEGDFLDGMEFSGIVFVSGDYFRQFNGPTSYLMLITVHEISHQWWYSLVGSDQAMTPWLDEALATYSEYVFIENEYPALKDWWWSFRVDSYSPQGFVDSTVYDFSSRRQYINAVYLRGVRMLDDLRNDLGTDAFFDWLRRYAEVGAGRIMTPEEFFALLSPQQFAETASTRERYLQHPQIIILATGIPLTATPTPNS